MKLSATTNSYPDRQDALGDWEALSPVLAQDSQAQLVLYATDEWTYGLGE